MFEELINVIDWFLIILMCVCIILDILSGLIKAAVEKNIQSGMMHTGLLKKTAYFIVVFLAIFLDWCSLHVDLPFEMHLLAPVTIFIIMIEIASILENVCIINPQLKDNKFLNLFGVKTEDEKFEEMETKNDA